jgi:predicted Zn-dependent protease with MMP-like domain
MDKDKFENLVSEALDTLPKEFAEKLENVGVFVMIFPSPYQLQKMNIPPNGLLFGLYEGVPKTKRSNYTGVLPDKITIFMIPILLVSKTEEDVRKKVRSVVMHEIGHHFGLSDEELYKSK